MKVEETTKEMFPFNPVIMSTSAARKINWADEDNHSNGPEVSDKSFSLTLPSPSTLERESFRN